MSKEFKPKSIQGAVIGRLLPAILYVIGNLVTDIEMDGVGDILKDFAVVLDKLRPSYIVNEIKATIYNERPQLRSYFSIFIFFYWIKRLFKVTSGEYLQQGIAYLIEKVADAIECYI